MDKWGQSRFKLLKSTLTPFIWVKDVDAVYQQVLVAGVACDPPVDREFGVRMPTVPDGMGYLWGFVKRI